MIGISPLHAPKYPIHALQLPFRGETDGFASFAVESIPLFLWGILVKYYDEDEYTYQ
jgi:hypothetical protein